MEAPSLQILIQKGPKSGETLTPNPNSSFKIGRVIKGNNFPIRDPGISQSHLRFDFLLEASRWFVTDLESSNGTFLNGSKIQAGKKVEVSDGDVVKIGDRTELLLKIEGGLREIEGKGKSRVMKEDGIRVLRGRRNNGGKKGIVSDEEGEKIEGLRSDSDLGEIEGAKREENSRVLRVRRKNPRYNEFRVSQEEEKQNEILRDSDSIVDLGPIEKKNENLGNSESVVNLGAIEKGKKRRGRAKKNELNEEKEEIRVLEEKEETRVSVAVSCLETEEKEEEVKVRRNPRRTNCNRVLKDLDGNSKIKPRGKGKQIRVLEEEQKANLVTTETENKSEGSDSDCVIFSDFKNEEGNGNTEEMRVELKNGEGNINSEEMEVDFEKMTLREWFGRMELVLEKIIRDESEQIKDILRAKAQKLDKFLQSGDGQKDV